MLEGECKSTSSLICRRFYPGDSACTSYGGKQECINKIGSALRIRLPNDCVVDNPIKINRIGPSVNLADYDEMIRQVKTRYDACAISEDLLRKDYINDILFMGYKHKPPNRRQRFKLKLKDLKQRCKDIWTIVSGGDIHQDCGY